MRLFSDMALPGRDVSWKTFLVTLKNEWVDDKVGDVAAGLTFYAVLGLFPFLLFLVSLASVIIDPTLAEVLVDQLAAVAPEDVTSLLSERIRQLGSSSSVGLLTFSALLAIWTSSGAVVSLMKGLNTAFDVEDSRPFWKQRLLAVGATLVAAAVALLAGLVAVVVPPIITALDLPFAHLWLWLRLPLAALLMMALWNFLFWLLPDIPNKRLRLVTPGSVVGVLVWVAASWGFSTYVSNFGNYDATYGALGAVVVLLFWMWISGQVVLLGAEINAVARKLGSRGKPPPPEAKPPRRRAPQPATLASGSGSREPTRPGAST